MKRTKSAIQAAAVAAFVAVGALASSANAEETIKIGVLHSLSGTMAISESTLKDTMLKPLWWIRHLTGRFLPRRRASF